MLYDVFNNVITVILEVNGIRKGVIGLFQVIVFFAVC